jgi:tetratricopeptide (TPR) repeat protein
VLEQGIERDPLNTLISGQLAIQWARRGRYEEAVALLDRFKRLPELPGYISWQIYRVHDMRGRTELADQSIVEMLEHEGYPEQVRRGQGNKVMVAMLGSSLREDWGLSDESEAWLTRLEGMPGPAWLQDYWLSKAELLGRDLEQASRMSDEEILDQGLWRSEHMVDALRQHGNYERAIPLLEAIAQESFFASARAYAPNLKLWLATVYLEAGRSEDAAAVLEELSQLLEPMVGVGIRNRFTLEQLARTQSLQGRVDAAISTLELSEASGNGTVFNCHNPEGYSEVLDPFAALRSAPRFQKLHDRCIAEFERQRDALRAFLAERDLDKLLAPWIAVAEEAKAKQRAEAASQ